VVATTRFLASYLLPDRSSLTPPTWGAPTEMMDSPLLWIQTIASMWPDLPNQPTSLWLIPTNPVTEKEKEIYSLPPSPSWGGSYDIPLIWGEREPITFHPLI